MSVSTTAGITGSAFRPLSNARDSSFLFSVSYYLLWIGILFPAITFNVIPGETGVLALLGSMLFLMLYDRVRLVIVLTITAIFLSFFSLISIPNSIPMGEILKQDIAYLQIALVASALTSKKFVFSFRHNELLIKFILAACLVGFFQKLQIFTGLLDLILKFMTSRGSAVAWDGRGVGFISNEPSHAAVSIFVWSFFIYLNGELKNQKIERRSFWEGKTHILLSYFVLLYGFLLTGAGMSLLLLTIFMIPFLISPRNIMLLLAAATGIYVFYTYSLLTDRFRSLVSVIVNAPSLLDLLNTISFLSGFRIPSVVVSYLSLQSDWVPSGVASWYRETLPLYQEFGFDVYQMGHFRFTQDVEPTKPYSIIANLALDFGILSVAVMIFLISRAIKSAFGLPIPLKNYLYLSVFGLLFMGTLGNCSWIAIFCLLNTESNLSSKLRRAY